MVAGLLTDDLMGQVPTANRRAGLLRFYYGLVGTGWHEGPTLVDNNRLLLLGSVDHVTRDWLFCATTRDEGLGGGCCLLLSWLLLSRLVHF